MCLCDGDHGGNDVDDDDRLVVAGTVVNGDWWMTTVIAFAQALTNLSVFSFYILFFYLLHIQHQQITTIHRQQLRRQQL